jgi:anti-sigma factor RsiW
MPELAASDPSEVNAFFKAKFPFAAVLERPLPSGVTLAGARSCYLSGAPAAYYILHRGETAVTAAVFSAEALDLFPMARARFATGPRLRCRVAPFEFVAHRAGPVVVTVVGSCEPAELEAIAAAFGDPP